MPVFRGVGERMKQRLRDLGYVRPNGELLVSAFCMDHRFVGTMFYDFLADRRTPIKDLERIAEALQTTPAWLLFAVAPTLIEGNARPDPRAVVIDVPRASTGRDRRSDRALVAVTNPQSAARAKKMGRRPKSRGLKRVKPISGGSDVSTPKRVSPKKTECLLSDAAMRQSRWVVGLARAA